MPKPHHNWVRRMWDHWRGATASELWWAQTMAALEPPWERPRLAPRQPHDGQTSDARKGRDALEGR